MTLKEHAKNRAKKSQLPAGEVLTVEQVWELSKLWYGAGLSRNFRGRTPEQANRIFRKLSLPRPFWEFLQ